MPRHETLGEQLQAARKARGLSLREVAIATGGEVTKTTLGRFELDERVPNLRNLVALAAVLRVRFAIDAGGVTLTLQRGGRRPASGS